MPRFDDIGMFWQDYPSARGTNRVAAVMPEIPNTGWETPKEFPNLSAAKVIALDIEGYDPELTTHGPGWARNSGHIVGVSIGVHGGKWYFPFRHEVEKEYNLEPEKVLSWLGDVLNTPSIPKVGANLIYDVGWLEHEGVTVAGDLVDVQYAEALLRENAKVALDNLASRYLGEHKDSELLYRWCADFYGGAINDKQRANIYRTPPRLTGPYAESDADLPMRLAPLLYDRLHAEGLLNVFNMECKLIRLLLAMRKEGVSVDVAKAEQVRSDLLKRSAEFNKRLKEMVGFEVNVNASASLAKAFDKIGLGYKKTTKGNPSFTKEFLKTVMHPIGNIIREIKTCEKMVGTFLEGYILNSHVNGKVYGQFHPLRSDDGGTRSGRFSSSTPNLQNIPIRSDLGKQLRSIFIPDPGHKCWRKYDYSQIEYRFLVHFAIGEGAELVRHLFRTDPSTDYHALTQKLVKDKTGIFLERKPIKNINFGLIYGMGVAKLARQIGISGAEGKKLFKAYHEGAPFAKATMEMCINEAQRTGVITTILGRKSRFDMWEPADYTGEERAIGLPYEKALMLYGNIKRAYTHKALNRKLQGSAADMMKIAMVRCWEEGIFDATGVPRLTVHDELDFSDPGGRDEAFKAMKHIMETALPISIPTKADEEVGPNWGYVEEIKKAA